MKRTMSTLLIAALATTVTYRVYDREMNLVEIWKDKGAVIDVYGPKYERKGRIEKEADRWSRYDREMRLEETIEREGNGEITLDRME